MQIQAQVFSEDYERAYLYYSHTPVFSHVVYTVQHSNNSTDTIISSITVKPGMTRIVANEMDIIQNNNGLLRVYHEIEKMIFDSAHTSTSFSPNSFAGVDAYPALQEFAERMKLVEQTEHTHIYECVFEQGMYTKIRYEFDTILGLFTKQEFFYNQKYYSSYKKVEIIVQVMPESCIESVDFSFDSFIRATNKSFEPIEKFADYSFTIVTEK